MNACTLESTISVILFDGIRAHIIRGTCKNEKECNEIRNKCVLYVCEFAPVRLDASKMGFNVGMNVADGRLRKILRF